MYARTVYGIYQGETLLHYVCTSLDLAEMQLKELAAGMCIKESEFAIKLITEYTPNEEVEEPVSSIGFQIGNEFDDEE